MIDSQISDARAKLDAARATESYTLDQQAKHAATIAAKKADIEAAQAELFKLNQRAAGMQQDVTMAQRVVAEHEDRLLDLLNVKLAAGTLALHREDPIGNNSQIVANVTALRTRVPDELNTPINKKFALHPLVSQALSLLPPVSAFDQPVRWVADWPRKRKAFIAAGHEPTPPMAA